MHIKHLAVNLAYYQSQNGQDSSNNNNSCIISIKLLHLPKQKTTKYFVAGRRAGYFSNGILQISLLSFRSLFISSVWLWTGLWPALISSGEDDMTSNLSVQPCVSRLMRVALGSSRQLMDSDIWTQNFTLRAEKMALSVENGASSLLAQQVT